jgi:F-type H+-transporting ATPase subunit epsilon
LSFSLTVLSAERELYSGEVDQLTLPTDLGEITVLANHCPLVANLHSGELMLRSKEKTDWLFVGGGVLEFNVNNECRVLADVAERVDEIDLKATEEARERAKKELEASESEPDVVAAKAALFHALAKIRIVEKNRRLKRKI